MRPGGVPALRRESLRKARNDHDTIPKIWIRRQTGVAALVEDVLVDLVRDDVEVALHGEASHRREFVRVEYPTGGVVGRVENQGPGARPHRCSEPLGDQAKSRRIEGYEHRSRL
jgi:hypothetical protein